MAITTLAELKTALAVEASRSDITWDDYITRGESRLNRKLRLLQQETTTALTLSADASTITLPTAFVSHIDLFYTTDNYQPTQQSWTDLQMTASTGTGRPNNYALADKIYFERSADQEYAMKQRYYAKWDLGTDSANWLLTNAPDAYIYSSLMAFYMRGKNPDGIAQNRALLDEVITELNTVDGQSRGKAKMAVDPGIVQTSRFNITRGY
jgi:hypothetical protein|tara:strand:+ start:215 stop:844 length:630 start_codon:yes stop_codon:yes gene_type:complete